MKRTARKRIIARMLWELITQGTTVLATGEELVLEPDEWLGLVKWVYAHIDGPPKSAIDVTSGGQVIRFLWSEEDDSDDTDN